jgi:hypothetical protein
MLYVFLGDLFVELNLGAFWRADITKCAAWQYHFSQE